MATKAISTSRWKAVLHLGLSLGLTGMSLVENFVLASAFFGLCVIACVGMLIRPRRLLLDDEGFTILGGLVRSPKKEYWRDIDDFFIFQIPKGGKAIGLNYKPDARGVSPLVRVSRLLGADGALPKGWTLSPEEIVEELNAYRRRAMGNGDSAVPLSALDRSLPEQPA